MICQGKERKMEIEKCKALLCAIELGSITAAAERLEYTTSGISRMLAALEAETGFSMLKRSRKGVIPTTDCEQLLPIMRELVYHADCYEQTVESIHGLKKGTITIGVSYGMYLRRIAKLIALFENKYPEIEFATLQGTSSELTEAIRQHKCDFCIISWRDGDHDWIPLKKDELQFMIAKNHKLAKEKTIPLSCINEETFIEIYPQKETDNSRCLEKNHIIVQDHFMCRDMISAMAMVEAGLGITIVNGVSTQTLKGDVVFRSIEPKEYVEIGIAVPSLQAISPAARAFLKFIKQHLDDV